MAVHRGSASVPQGTTIDFTRVSIRLDESSSRWNRDGDALCYFPFCFQEIRLAGTSTLGKSLVDMGIKRGETIIATDHRCENDISLFYSLAYVYSECFLALIFYDYILNASTISSNTVYGARVIQDAPNIWL